MLNYGYTDKNLLEEKETYQYSKYYGAPFVDAFFENRTNFLNSIKENSIDLFFYMPDNSNLKTECINSNCLLLYLQAF